MALWQLMGTLSAARSDTASNPPSNQPLADEVPAAQYFMPLNALHECACSTTGLPGQQCAGSCTSACLCIINLQSAAQAAAASSRLCS